MQFQNILVILKDISHYIMKRTFRLTLILSIFFLASCSQGFTDEEKKIISDNAPAGRTDYDGKIMKVWKISDYEDSLLLRRTALPVNEEMIASEDFSILCERMLTTVRDSLDEGVGIAAPQVGISRRLIAVQRFDKDGEPFEFYINPSIVEMGDSTAKGMEGCLSVPDIRGAVERAQKITLKYLNDNLRDTTEIVEGFSAVIFQHEIDHLDGILFIDRLEK